MLFDLGVGIAHGDTETCEVEHLDVVGAVAEGHGFLAVDAEVVEDVLHANSFAAVVGNEVCEGGMPTGHAAMREAFEDLAVLFGRLYGNELVGFTIAHLVDG